MNTCHHVALALKCWVTSRASRAEGIRMVALSFAASTHPAGSPMHRLFLGQVRGTFRRAVAARRERIAYHDRLVHNEGVVFSLHALDQRIG